MYLSSIKLNNFRCFKTKTVSFSTVPNFIYGSNASGKSSIIEAVSCLGVTKSFRTNDHKDLINFGNDYYFIEGLIDENGRQTKLSLFFNQKGKKAKKNNFTYNKLSDYIGYLNCVIFSSDDFFVLQKGSKERRSMFDVIFCQISNEYLKMINYYKKLLKDRNALLKRLIFENKHELYDLIYVVSYQLAEQGKKIVSKRIEFLQKINQKFNAIHSKIADGKEEVEIKYETSNEEKNLFNALKNNIVEEIKTGYTLYGPHKNDYLFIINNQNASKFASQGQQRSLILSLKLAMAELIYDETGKTPVVLLDDVFSELDKNRQNALINALNPGFQTIITAASLSDIDENILKKANLINITTKEN